MNLASPTFLFLFLPCALAGYYLAPRPARPALLLVMSLVFYALGDLAGLPVLGASILGNYLLGLWLQRTGPARRKAVLTLGLCANLGLLAKAKYMAFAVANLPFLEAAGLDTDRVASGLPPLGISFFTFQAVAYLVDVAKGRVTAEKSPLRLGLALAFFGKIAAGPIPRQADLEPGLHGRLPGLAGFAEGVRRFIFGLAKKTLVAGTLAPLADAAFARSPAPDMGTAWLGLVAYAGQIYFDFSGYTDMAVGLGRMFGLPLPENFDHPYVSRSIREFWRRWHMSLSSWFRDYLYIPLGGGRAAPWRVYFNLALVFTLCGLWHGASFTFVAWGAWHGAFLVLERAWLGRRLDAWPRAAGHAYALAAVVLGWVFFRAESLSSALAYFSALFSFRFEGLEYTWMLVVNRQMLLALGAAVVLSLPAGPVLTRLGGLFGPRLGPRLGAGLETVALPALFLLSAMYLAAGGYAPFIYARF